MTKWITIALAVLGLAIGLGVALTSGKDEPEPPPAAPPSVNPFDSGIAATGIVESSTRNVAVAAPEAGLVTQVAVQVNDPVAAGDLLFVLDNRELESQLAVAEAQVGVAQAQAEYARLENQRIAKAFAADAATPDEKARNDAQAREAESRLAESRAQAQLVRTRIDRRRVTSPVAGRVLKRNLEPGEYTSPASPTPANGDRTAALIVGDLQTLHVRAQINEEDAVNLRANAHALARLRGGGDQRLALTMLRIEPLAVPKTQLTGVNTELIDTRVIEALFRLEPPLPPGVYPGQLVDVYIQTPGGDTTNP